MTENSRINKADITIAIATMDRPLSLNRLLCAIAAGTVLPAEVIVVDQSRKEETENMVQASFQDLPVPLVYLRQPPLGLSASRNLAARHAHAPVITFTDDDCVPDPNWVKTIQKNLSSPGGPDAVSGRVLPLGPDTPGFYPVSVRSSEQRVDYRGKKPPWLAGTGGNFAVRQSWLSIAGPFDERFGAGSSGKAAEDAEWIYRLLLQGAVIRYDPDVLIYHERQPRASRLKSYFTYAYGVGALCGLILRRRDAYSAVLLISWWANTLRGWVRGLLYEQGLRLEEHWLKGKGFVTGLRYGFQLDPAPLKGENERFTR